MTFKEADFILWEYNIDPFEYVDSSIESFTDLVIRVAEDFLNKSENGEKH